MSYIKGDNEKEQEIFDFLEDLRQSGRTNMFGATPYIQSAFNLPHDKAVKYLTRWMDFHNDPLRRNNGPTTIEKTTVEFSTIAKIRVKPRKEKI